MRLPDPATSRAVLIGTRTYAANSGLEDLPGVTGNIVQLGHLLPTVTGLSPGHCRTLLDQSDDRAVCQEIRKASREAEDLLLVYFAGHGLIDPESGELFLALSRSDPDEPLYTAVRFAEIREAVAASRARNRVIILDCCYSGRAIVDAMGTDVAASAFAQTDTFGAYTLTATSANLPAIARAGDRHTLFTGGLLRLIAEGVEDAGPYLTLSCLYDELRRTLSPQPRQQGSDSAGQIALAPNPAYLPRQPEPGARAEPRTPVSETATRQPVTFRTNVRRVIWQRLLLYFAITCPPGAAAFFYVLWLSHSISIIALAGSVTPLLACSSLVYGAYQLHRVPRRYLLRVDQDGLRLTIDESSVEMHWQDVRRITTVRTRAWNVSPPQLLIVPRRGYAAPPRRRLRVEPYIDGRRQALVFCDLRRFKERRPGEVEAAISSFAGGLWDVDHGLGEASTVRFGRPWHENLLAAASGAFLFGVFSVAAFFVLFEPPTPPVPAALWLVPPGLVVVCAVVPMVRPPSITLDSEGASMRHAFRQLRLPWGAVTSVVAVWGAERGRHYVLVRTQPPDRGSLWLMPYDRTLGGYVFDRQDLAPGNEELAAAFTHFVGPRWQGFTDELSVLRQLSDTRAVFSGRLTGPSGWAIGALTPLAIAAVVSGGAFTTAPPVTIGVMAVDLILGLLLLVLVLQQRLELRIDHGAIELAAGRTRTRIAWSDVSRVELVPPERAPHRRPCIVVWLKDGAATPARWRWGGCLRPWSGGVHVTCCQLGRGTTAITATAAQVEQALAHYAGGA
ncbi:caspase family protein [Streptomyces sp. NPDC054961]